MNYKDSIKEEISYSPKIIFEHPTKKIIFLYFEQNVYHSVDDENFYSIYIKTTFFGFDIEFISCSDRKGVLKEVKVIQKDHVLWDRYKFHYLFFIDKDYNDITEKEETIFITKYHSIENYYVSLSNYLNLLKRFYGIRSRFEKDEKDREIKEKELMNKLENFYKKTYSDFIDKTSFLMAAFKYNLTPGNTQIPKFNHDKSLRNILRFNYDENRIDFDFEENLPLYSSLLMKEDKNNFFDKNIWNAIQKIAEEYKNKIIENKSELVRGKQDFEFFFMICDFTQEKLKEYSEEFLSKKPKFSIFQSEIKQFKKILSGFIEPPPDLIEFLYNNRIQLERKILEKANA